VAVPAVLGNIADSTVGNTAAVVATLPIAGLPCFPFPMSTVKK